MKKAIRLLLLLLLPLGFGACNKVLNVGTGSSVVSVTAAFNDSTSAVAAVTGVYVLMLSHGFFEWSGISYFTARSADEVVFQGGDDLFASDSLDYTNNDVYSMWVEGFATMLSINTNVNALQSTTGLSSSLRRQLLGEMLFSRAFENFYLVNLWGDAVPVLTSADVNVNQDVKSASRQQVYAQIIADLQEAQGDLSTAYPTPGRVRPNLMAADALLARVYLYQGRYSDAIAQASTVINSNLYSPLPPVGSVFLATSTEAIWQLPPSELLGGQPVGDAVVYYTTPSSLTPELLAAFEPGDLRRQSWVASNVYNGNTYTIPNKYKRSSAANDSLPDEYEVVLRLAEQYLIRAEANARLGQVSAALADIDIVRARAGLPPLADTLSQPQCIAAVEHERRVELFAEWGHRWFDLKRWTGISNPSLTRADEVLGAIKPGWQSYDQYYPVPQSELQLDPNLVQNPGYPAH